MRILWAMMTWMMISVKGELMTKANRSYSYSSSLCFVTPDSPDCRLECSYWSKVDMRLVLDKELEQLWIKVIMRDLESSCPLQLSDKQFGARIAGEKVEKYSESKDPVVRGLEDGVIETILAGIRVYEGNFSEYDKENCVLTQVSDEKMDGFDVRCQMETGDRDLVVRPIVRSDKEVRLIHSELGARKSVHVKENVLCSTNIEPDLGVQAVSHIKLDFLNNIEDDDEVGRELTDHQVGKESSNEISAQELIDTVKSLLVKIQKSNINTIEGTEAFVDLVNVVRDVTAEQSKPLVDSFKTKKAFKNIVNAVAGAGNFHLWRIVLNQINKDKKNNKNLEMFLLGTSFTIPTRDLVTELRSELESLVVAKSELMETALYSLCRLEGRLLTSDTRYLLNLARSGQSTCQDLVCHRRLVNCVVALDQNLYSEDLVEMARSGAPSVSRELALATLAKPGLVPSDKRDQVNREMMDIFMEDEDMMIKQAALHHLNVDNQTSGDLMSSVNQPNQDIRSLVGQKLTQSAISRSSQISKNKVLNYHIMSLQHGAKSVFLEQEIARLANHKVDFKFGVVMKAESLKRTHFVVQVGEESGTGKDLFSIDSYVGGLSSYVGDADPEDDEDANGWVQLSLLGLPLPSFTLFSAFSDLVNLYWSGETTKLTSLLHGSISLLHTNLNIPLAIGHNLQLTSSAVLTFDISGKAEISIWTQSGDTHMETRGLMVADMIAQVGGMKIDNRLAGEMVLDMDISTVMGASVDTCVVVSQRDLVVRNILSVTTKGDTTVTQTEKQIPGISWNLNKQNNQMCTKLEK